MTVTKRVIDIVLSLVLGILLLPLLCLTALVIRIFDGAPVFYASERMRDPQRGFQLIKFRTMSAADRNSGVTGGDKNNRITRVGAALRRYRLDELPQLWNILRGDMSFVGPRPPLRRYVELFPDLYRDVLRSRPGVTGLATLAFHRREEALLDACATPEDTEAAYVRRCVPQKARLDLIYARHRGTCWDLRLMVATVFRRVPLRGKPK